MKIVMGSKIFERSEFESEAELEEVVRSYSNVIFGNDVIYIPQKLITTLQGSSTIPEAIAVDLDAARWYIIEVELAKHGMWSHIAPQITKQIVAAENPKVRKEIVQKVINEIEKSDEWKQKFKEKGIHEIKVLSFLQEIFEKDPLMVIPIDAVPPDLEVFSEVLNRDLIPVLVEKYKSADGEVAYRIASSKLMVLPEDQLPEDSKTKITEEEFLKKCQRPGVILYHRLKELAETVGDRLVPGKSAFSYYIVTKSGKKFCPFTIWPDGVAIYKLRFTEKYGVTEEAHSKFKDNLLRIECLKSKYGSMKIPIMSTRVGEITEYEVDLFIEAFKEFRNSIAGKI